MTRFEKLLLLCVALIGLHKFCTRQTSGFTIEQTRAHFSHHPNWEVDNTSLDPSIFNQKFHYLDAGGQAYVFASADGRYVLKFFKQRYPYPHLWQKILSLAGPFSKKKRAQIAKHTAKLYQSFDSYVLAKQALSEEAGLVYVHLNQTQNSLPNACLVDRLNIAHTLALDQTAFILQKKADLLYPYLLSLIEKRDLEEGKKALDSVISLLLARCQKGIHDEDAKIHRNLGFYDQKAILIDVGRLNYDERRKDPRLQKQDLQDMTRRVRHFLKENAPEFSSYLEAKINAL